MNSDIDWLEDPEERNHPAFKKNLRASQKGVWDTAQWLNHYGMKVTVNPTEEADTYKNRHAFMDDGDIEIMQKIEVKVLGYKFTSQEDWPFHRFAVCNVNAWDRAKRKPYAYLIWSSDRHHLAIVYGSTNPHWFSDEMKDRRYEGYAQRSYFCPMEFVRWTNKDETDCPL
jgi:hypothetical protein|tara:strand:+ start:298 stop:807 length:510 start_codon:yes stop_codon:yes gene_type:complete